ncbi:MAG: autotransporter-associated beta strand repeat-containing protein [Verrucomicrobiota bacterium JB022]|nr:autotransporter-associated beta strand repeat-containing protein [Verrucomicrobiota bacterium JB022]
MWLAICAGFASTAHAQFAFYESFTYSAAPGWRFSQGDTSPGPYLTAGTAVGDTEGNGWLRLTTQNVGNQSNAVFLDTKIPSNNNTIDISFDLAMYGGTGADGFTFFLYDASIDLFTPGAYGGSLGYANRSGVGGMPGGYVGIAFDNYGNNSNSGEGRNGGLNQYTTGSSTTLYDNAIVVRGPDTGGLGGQDGFQFLASTGGGGINGVNTTILNGNGTPTTVNRLTEQMDFAGSARPSAEVMRSARIVIDENDLMTIYMRFGLTAEFLEVMQVDMSNLGVERPDELRLGFAGSTGGSTQTIEMRRIDVETSATGDTWIWDNSQGSGQKYWGNANDGPNGGHKVNWLTDTNPGTGLSAGQSPNVVFNNAFVSEDQAITVQDGNKTIDSMTFGGQYRYTLNPDATQPGIKIIFDNGNDSGASYLNVLNNAQGNAEHTLNVDLELQNELQIDHYVEKTLTINGDIKTNGNVLDVETVSKVILAGDIASSNEIRKGQPGTLVLQGDNSAWTGDLQINGGTVVARTNTGLGVHSGSNAVDVNVANGATLAFDALSGNGSYRPKSIVLKGGSGADGKGALQSLAGTNTLDSNTVVRMDGSTTVGASAGSTLVINPGITTNDQNNNYNFTKTGEGTVELNGRNAYRGTTTISQGTLSVGDNAPNGGNVTGSLGNASSTVVIGNSSTGSSDLALVTNRSGITVARNLSVNNYGGKTTLGGTHTSGTSSFTGNIDLYKDIYFTAAGNGTVNFTGNFNNSNGRTATKVGEGTVVLSGSNSLGTMNIEEGRIRIANISSLNAWPTVNLADRAGASFELGLSGATRATIGSLNGGGTNGGNVYLNDDTLRIGNGGVGYSNYGGVISGTGSLELHHSHELTLTNTSTYSGDTILNDRAVIYLNNQNGQSLANTRAIYTSNDAIVRLGADNQINDDANYYWNGGRFDTNGFSDILGDFTFRNQSYFGFTGDSSIIEFDNWGGTASGTLYVQDWDGDAQYGGGIDQFLVSQNVSGSSTLLNNIRFSDWGNATATTINRGNGIWEIVPQFSISYTWDGSSNNSGSTRNDWLQRDTYSLWGYTWNGPYENWVDDPYNQPQGVGVAIYMPDVDNSYDNWDVDPNGSITLGYWMFSGQDDYTIRQTSDNSGSASNKIILDASTGPARISMTGDGDRIIGAELQLNDDLIWSNSGTGTVLKNGSNLNLNGKDITFRGTGTTTVSSAIVGNNSSDLTKEGSGTLVLSGNNTYGGTTTIKGGILMAAHNNALGSNNSGTTVQNGGTLGLSGGITITNENLTLNGAGHDNLGALYNASGNNTYNGSITLGSNSAIGAAAGTELTIQKGISGSAGLVKVGDGTVDLKANNSFTGDVHVAAGTLKLSANDNIGNNANLSLANQTGARVVLNGRDETVGSLSGGGSNGGNVELGSNTLTTGGNNASTVYGGSISGTGNLVKNGTGTLTLTGESTMTGNITVNNSTLNLASANGPAIDGANKININGGTLLLSDHEQVAGGTALALNNAKLDTQGFSNTDFGKLTLASSSTFDLGAGASILKFEDSSSLAGSWTSSDFLIIENWSGKRSGGGTDQIFFGSDASALTSGQVSRIFFKNPNGFGEGYWAAMLLENGELVPVPEPATILGASALVLLIGGHGYRRHRQRQAAQATAETPEKQA